MLVTAPAHAQEPSSLTETYGAWKVQCGQTEATDTAPAVKTCQMVQELVQQQSLKRIYLMAIRTTAEGSSQITLVAPFGLLLSEGVSLNIDDKLIAKAPFRTCWPAGCVARQDLTEVVTAALQANLALNLVATTEVGQTLTVEMSLDGFTNAYARLKQLAE